MKRSMQWLGTASAFALVLAPAMAAAAPVGTAANSSISNSVTVSYNVGGVAQTPITSAADVFTVDRKIDLVVTTQDSTAVSVTPGQTNAVTRFTVRSTWPEAEEGVDVTAVYRAADGRILSAESTVLPSVPPGGSTDGTIRLLSPIPDLAATEVFVGRGLAAQTVG